METNHKEFKPFDKVLVLLGTEKEWNCDLYSHYDNEYKCHRTFKGYLLPDKEILPYEGNEHLVGTTDEPDEEVKLEEGEWILATDVDSINFENAYFWNVTVYSNDLKSYPAHLRYKYYVRFKDFNPNDIEETRKHILCVKNGKVVKYHGKD